MFLILLSRGRRLTAFCCDSALWSIQPLSAVSTAERLAGSHSEEKEEGRKEGHVGRLFKKSSHINPHWRNAQR